MTPPRDPNQLPVLDRATGLDDGYDCPECGFAATCADCSDGCDDYCPECNLAWPDCECPIDEGELP